MHDDTEFIIMLICAVILIPLVILFTKLIGESDLPLWLKFVLLK